MVELSPGNAARFRNIAAPGYVALVELKLASDKVSRCTQFGISRSRELGERLVSTLSSGVSC
jgi:hypothetical protein